jgi:DNA-binding response OmpR family regulator
MQKVKILFIVDDECDICLAIKMVLEDNGFKVDSFTDPLVALGNFKADLYDLLILDIKMPKMDGFELYDKIKKKDNNAKICFLTASELYNEEFRNKEYRALDRNLFIQKPINNEDLVKEINKITS